MNRESAYSNDSGRRGDSRSAIDALSLVLGKRRNSLRLTRLSAAVVVAFAVGCVGRASQDHASSVVSRVVAEKTEVRPIVVKENVWLGVYANSQADQGGAVYLARCSTCHEEDLSGRHPAPPLVGRGFLSKWSGRTVRDLYGRIRTTMPTDAPGSLSREETLEILAFIFRANGLPSGTDALAGSVAELQRIKITQHAQVQDDG